MTEHTPSGERCGLTLPRPHTGACFPQNTHKKTTYYLLVTSLKAQYTGGEREICLKEVASKSAHGLPQEHGVLAKKRGVPSTPGIRSQTATCRWADLEVPRAHSGEPEARQTGTRAKATVSFSPARVLVTETMSYSPLSPSEDPPDTVNCPCWELNTGWRSGANSTREMLQHIAHATVSVRTLLRLRDGRRWLGQRWCIYKPCLHHK